MLRVTSLFTFVALITPLGTSGFGIHSIHEVSTSIQHVVDHSTTIASTVSNAPNLLDLYKESLATQPLLTKMFTGGTLAVTGDAIAQSQVKEEEYSKRRAVSFMMFDMCYRALQHVSFPIIVQNLQGQYIGGAVASMPLISSMIQHSGLDDPTYYYGAMEQTLASQLGIVPFLYYPVFYILTAFVQGLSAEGAVTRAKETFIPLMKRNLLFWIPVQFVQFGFIEESLQIPFLALCGLVWTFIISLFAGNANKSYSKDNTEIEVAIKGTNPITIEDVKEIEKTIIMNANKERLTEKEEKEFVLR